jgi:hypothetical protein
MTSPPLDSCRHASSAPGRHTRNQPMARSDPDSNFPPPRSSHLCCNPCISWERIFFFFMFLRSYNLKQKIEMRNETVNINLRLLASESHSRLALNLAVSLYIKLQCWWKFPEFETGAPRRKMLHPVTRFLSFSLNSVELCIEVLQPRVIYSHWVRRQRLS